MNLLRAVEKRIWKLKKPIVQKNIQFKNIHKGETCLIFGNGSSLKYYDFSALPKIPAIGCSYSLTDTRMKDVNMQYCVMSDSYLLYPFRPHSLTRKLQRNKIGPILRKIILTNKKVTFFSNLTNYFSFLKQPENLHYFHHFGERDNENKDLAGLFFANQGALSIMIGVAKYLGFSKAILLGCDYLGSPKLERHFYADKEPVFGNDDRYYCEQIKEVTKGIDILCIFPNGIKSLDFPSSSFEEFTSSKDHYRKNSEFIDPVYLEMMYRCVPSLQIVM